MSEFSLLAIANSIVAMIFFLIIGMEFKYRIRLAYFVGGVYVLVAMAFVILSFLT